MYHVKRTAGEANAPLFLTFHGTGGTEEQFHGLAEQLHPGAHVTSPRGDVSEYGAARFFKRTGEGVYDMDDLAHRTIKMSEFIRAEITHVGASKTIGLGYSNGANILAAVALKTPDLVDDLILMHPLIPWTPEPQPRLGGRRILITAGRRDPICPAPQTQELADYLLAQGANVTMFWHDGGHEITQSEIQKIADFCAA
ncbi:alpha/beta hydrolase [Loktanella sp. S4079]|uniref:alpha/beta hydrolase n=1 Tax=Loktanella sp. S4079 TaxID=579483 RepID=UPI0005FA922D|nr:alpha/beta hydrolase [Loktanella sp. S4079]KJZ19287.1 esterase [Loktanella sp. S4079]